MTSSVFDLEPVLFNQLRLLVCGGRNYDDHEAVDRELSALAETYGWLTIINGGANGADKLAREWAEKHYHGVVTFHAEWGRLGSVAGPIRNERMIILGKPDMVLAFPGGKGTADMVRRAKSHGIYARLGTPKISLQSALRTPLR
jgi:hypothetical protein